jgi:hypothetical protein
MKLTALVAVVLIAVGVVALAYEGITYTRDRTVLDIGPVEARVEEKRTIPLPPILGALAIAGGVALLLATRESRTA